MSEDLKTFEFGNQIMVSGAIDKDDPMLRTMVEQSIEQSVGALKYITDFKTIQEPEIFDLPRVDILNRFSCVGWRAKYASNGYWELKEHFKCRNEHIPKKITAKFIWQMIIRLKNQRKVKDYE